MLTTLARLQHTSSDLRAMLGLGKSAKSEAECLSSADELTQGPGNW